jgi:hypothetical protein
MGSVRRYMMIPNKVENWIFMLETNKIGVFGLPLKVDTFQTLEPRYHNRLHVCKLLWMPGQDVYFESIIGFGFHLGGHSGFDRPGD